jgi:hypothetical protein
MSSFRLVQRPVVELDSPAKEMEEVLETGGMISSDSRFLELIKDRAGHLALLDSTRKRGAQRVRYKRRIHVPPMIDASLSEALTLPTGRAFASTADLVVKIRILFTDHGICNESAKKLAYWALSTWFADLFPSSPCLLLTGSRPEANLALRLLACVVRHGLPLADISLSGLRSLPMQIQPTLLISRLSPAMLKVLSASNYPRAYIPIRDGVGDLYCAKAVYAGTSFLDDRLDGAFRVHLPPCCGRLPVVSDFVQEKLTADLQPLLLDYRMRDAAKVRDSDFEVPELQSEVRILARALGSAIVDAPELRTDLVNLLQEYQDEIRAGDAFNGESIAIEALLSHIHSEQSDQLLYVGQLADISNRILKDRGSREKLEPKAVGWMLRNSLGFTPKRNGKGFAIKMTEDVRRRVHQLARQFQVLAVDEVVAGCSQCRETLAPDGNEAKIEQGTGPAGTSAA